MTLSLTHRVDVFQMREYSRHGPWENVIKYVGSVDQCHSRHPCDGQFKIFVKLVRPYIHFHGESVLIRRLFNRSLVEIV